MQTVKIKNKAAKKMLKGYPLVTENDLMQPIETTDWVRFVTPQNEKIGVGYIGKQNKGSGWLIRTEDEVVNQHTFEQLFNKAIANRQFYFDHQEVTNAIRLFNGEGDGLGGVTIDYYDSFVVFSWYNETIYAHRQLLIDALLKALPTIKGVYEKIRFQSPTENWQSRFVCGQKADEPLVILENGVRYATYLDEGLMTGIFLDQKEVRGRLVNGLACGMNVLNMFSYTGAFSIAAAMGGASHTVSVDLAKRSLAKTTENFVVNGLNPADYEIRVMDVFDYVHWAVKKQLQFDMIVLDPPSFARNGKKTFSVAKDYGKLVASVLPLLKKGGYLIASTNAANVTIERYQAMIQQAFQSEKRQANQIYFDQLPADFAVDQHFKEGNYLKVFTYQVN